MMLRHTDRDCRGNQGAGPLADPPRDNLGANRIGADQTVRPVLLGRANRQDDPPAILQISLDFLPSLQLQLHSRSFRSGLTSPASDGQH
jgi:hypothetical protein